MKKLSAISKMFIKVMGLQKWCLIHKKDKWGGEGCLAREKSEKCQSGPRAKRVGHHCSKVLKYTQVGQVQKLMTTHMQWKVSGENEVVLLSAFSMHCGDERYLLCLQKNNEYVITLLVNSIGWIYEQTSTWNILHTLLFLSNFCAL